jgi:tetratricopeptide (TPR) repeat protein
MELLYNPSSMPEEEIKATFVAREWLIDELIDLVKGQPDGAGIQHVLVIAPRGMGKTTVLLMLQFALKDRALAEQWQAVRFPEEAYGIYDLADFWVEALRLLSAATNDSELQSKAESLKSQFKESDDLADAALAMLKDWRRQTGKRILLLIDNFDMILEQINDERDVARLRDVLMNNGAIMMVGCAASFFHEVRSYDQPLYNFFKTQDLERLGPDQVEQLLRRRADLDRLTDFGAKLDANRARFKALEYFAGGYPRLVLMLYRVVTLSDLSEVRSGLEKLLDEVTPYYKARVEILAPQPRKILDIIARITGKTGVGVTPTEIAAEARLSPNQVSSQLKRLTELGYVRAAPVRGRSTYYSLSEPLYAIWHQMRFGRSARERMHWLVAFLQSWYEVDEMRAAGEQLQTLFKEYVSSGMISKAKAALEHQRYLAEALAQSGKYAFDEVIRGYLDIEDEDTLELELLASLQLERLSPETVAALAAHGCIASAEAERVLAERSGSVTSSPEAEAKAARLLFSEFMRAKRHAEAEDYLRRLRGLGYFNQVDWVWLTIGLTGDGKLKEAIPAFDGVIAAPQGTADFRALAFEGRGYALAGLERYEESAESLRQAAQNGRDSADLQRYLGTVFRVLNKPEQALSCFEKSLAMNQNDGSVWEEKGRLLASVGSYDEAIESLTEALRIEPESASVLRELGSVTCNAGLYSSSERAYDQLLAISPLDTDALTWRGLARLRQTRYSDAVDDLSVAVRLSPDSAFAWASLGIALEGLGRLREAIESFDQVIATNGHDKLRIAAHLARFSARALMSTSDLPKDDWEASLKMRDCSPELWADAATAALTVVARTGKLRFALDLITNYGLVDPLFPLARALEYLLSGDQSLIETLSPEIRGVVETVIADLLTHAGSEEKPDLARSAEKTRPARSGPKRPGSPGRRRVKNSPP